MANGKYYININGKTVSGSHGMIDDLVMLEDGTYSYAYKEYRQSKDCYIVINGKENGPYIGFADNLRILKDGKFAVKLYSGRMITLFISGNQFGPYPSIDSYSIMDSGDFYFTASDHTQTKFMAVINDLFYGPFEEKAVPRIREGGKYIMPVKTEGKYFLLYNGIVLGPYEKLERLKTDHNWSF
ncbi:MAG: hypothetical protein VB022_04315 [Rikenellaceae bacterium]|nr:hypothetical protein [Rikenellaceae bacterium]